jgi:hypothetical protein
MKLRWIILIIAGAAVVLTWSAALITYLFFDPSLALWAGLVTAGALSLEAFFWVGAGVLGWSFLAGRRAMLDRLRRRLLGRGRANAE